MNGRKIALTLALTLLVLMTACACAETRVAGLDPRYEILIDDQANLLSDEEEQKLADDMMPLTRHGTVAFWTTDTGFAGTESMARDYLSEHVSGDIHFSCALLLIDMSHRQLWIQCRGTMLDTIGISNCYTITGNVASKATVRRYYACAAEAFRQLNSVFLGERLASPMRIVCCVLMALALALLFTYRRVRRESVQPDVQPWEVAALVAVDIGVKEKNAKLIRESKTRKSSDSSSSGCFSCGGGGGSSCGSSCGGGGGSGF